MVDESSAVEAVYPLTPLQEGMLYHCLSEGVSAYVCQSRYWLRGRLEPDHLVRAWESTSLRHGTMRSCVVHAGLPRPVQAVYRAPLPMVTVASDRDWSEEEVDADARAEVRAGFDLDRAPLHRVRLLRRGPHDWEMIWTAHHLMIDGWSTPLVISEVFSEYARLAGAADTDPAAPAARPYRDYVAWLKQRDAAAALEHWQRVLGDVDEPTPLPGGPVMADAGRRPRGHHTASLPAQRIRAALREQRVTLGTLVQAAWALVLARYAGREDVLFGATVSGRPAELDGAERMVGLFINTLPVRIRTPGRARVGAWLQQVQRQLAAGREFEHTSLADLRAVCPIPGDRPLFESIVVVENYPVLIDAGLAAHGDVLRIVAARTSEELVHPLVFSVAQEEQLQCELFTDRRRIPDALAEQMLTEVKAVLAALVEDPARPVAEVADLVRGRPALTTPPPSPAPPLVLASVCAAAAAEPDRVAVVDGDRTLTYGELIAAVDAAAARLRRENVAGRPVALLAERSAARVVATLATWQAGGVHLPVDPDWPAAWLAQVLRQAGPAIVVASDPTLVPSGHATLSLSKLLDSGAPGGTGSGAGPGPAYPAYMIFTSGSTGLPKPVVVDHAALATAAAGWRSAHHLTDRTQRHLHLNNPAFDVALAEVVRALSSGRTLVVCPVDTAGDAAALVDLVEHRQVDLVDMPPTLLRAVLEYLEASGRTWDAVRTVLVGGEAWTIADYLRLLQATAPSARLVNAYGITETCVETAYLDTAPVGADTAAVPVTRAYAGTSVTILDGRLRPVPLGAEGEVYVGGSVLASGYWGDPVRTAMRFVPDPNRAAGRLYRTGDRARWLPDGGLELCGRRDGQLKIRGFRVDPAQVEAVVRGLPGVVDVGVAAPAGRLVACVTGRDDELDLAALPGAAAGQLPAHAVPVFARVASLPHTPAGKLDRRALDRQVAEFVVAGDPDREAGYVAPGTAVEQALADAWSQVLGAEKIGVHDNFFGLGGDSIVSLRMVGLAAGHGLALSPRDVFSHQTIAELATVVGRLDAPTDDRVAEGADVPLMPVQQMFLQYAGADPSHFDMAQRFDITASLDPGLLGDALQEVSRWHAALRLRFARTPQGRWRQYLSGEASVQLDVVDLRRLDDSQRRDRLAEVQQQLRATRDLDREPPWACVLLPTDIGCHLLIAAHHLVFDAFSWRVLLEDLFTVYRALAAGTALPPAPAAGYPEYARAAAAASRGELARPDTSWLRQLAAARPVPTDHDRGPNTLESVDTITFALSAELTGRMHRTDRTGLGVTPVLVTLTAALARAYHRWCGDPLYLYLETHGRDAAFGGIDLSRTIGWFTTLQPLAVAAAHTEPPARSWDRVHDVLAAMPQPAASFGLLRWCGTEPGDPLRELPLPQVSLNHIGGVRSDVGGLGGARIQPLGAMLRAAPDARRDCLIEFETTVVDGVFDCAVNYSRNHHTTAGMERLADAFRCELTSLIELN